MSSHSHSSHSEENHGSFGSYTIGFVLSVILTAAAFGVVLKGALTGTQAIYAIAGLGLVQIIVHVIFFLHMNGSSSQRWNLTAFAYTVLTAVIVIGGTLWVMHNVSMNMMSR
jgi:cytochrome o ubiquinol oxidase operon protein cyoD